MDDELSKSSKTVFKKYQKGSIDYAQADEQFHSEIIQASGSTRLVGLVNNLKDSLQMLDMRAVSFRYPERIKESMAEHLKIIEAFRAKDAVLAEKLTREHFQHTRFYYERHLESGKSQEGL